MILVVLVARDGRRPRACTTSPRRASTASPSASIYALGAVGLTLVYGILKLVNFAHGDFLTFGAYMAYLVNVDLGDLPLVVGVFFAMSATAVLGDLLREGDVGADAGPQAPGCCSWC